MNKKFIALFLVLALVLSMGFAGCSNGEEGESSTDPENSESTTTTEGDGEKVWRLFCSAGIFQ